MPSEQHFEFYVLLTVHLGSVLVNNQSLVFRVTYMYTRCRVNTIDSPNDEHRGARDM